MYTPEGVRNLACGFKQTWIWILPPQLKKSTEKLSDLSDPIFSTLKSPTHGMMVIIIWNCVHKADSIVPSTQFTIIANLSIHFSISILFSVLSPALSIEPGTSTCWMDDFLSMTIFGPAARTVNVGCYLYPSDLLGPCMEHRCYMNAMVIVLCDVCLCCWISG